MDTTELANIASAKKTWSYFLGTLGGSSYDIQNASEEDLSGRYDTFFNGFADDVEWRIACTPELSPLIGGELHGKQQLIDFMMSDSPGLVQDNYLSRPVEFVASGDRVIMLGAETYTVRKSGVTARDKDFVWVMDFKDGLIGRILYIGDMSAFADAYLKN